MHLQDLQKSGEFLANARVFSSPSISDARERIHSTGGSLSQAGQRGSTEVVFSVLQVVNIDPVHRWFTY